MTVDTTIISPKIILKGEIIINIINLNIILISKDEEFTSLEDFPDYYISNRGRVFSSKSNKILKPQIIGNKNKNNDYTAYRLVHISGATKTVTGHILVAKCFLKNSDPSNKTEVHHKDKNRHNNYYKNLIYVSREEHKILDEEIKVYLCNPFTQYQKKCKSFQELAGLLDVNPSFLYKLFSKGPIKEDENEKYYTITEDFTDELRFVLIKRIKPIKSNAA